MYTHLRKKLQTEDQKLQTEEQKSSRQLEKPMCHLSTLFPSSVASQGAFDIYAPSALFP
jgi:hypothetical protein